MDEASQLAKRLSESLVHERDVNFTAMVRKRALSYAKRRAWVGRVVACASMLVFALTLEGVRRAAMTALAPALAAITGDGFLMQAPIGLTLAVTLFFMASLALFRP